MGKDPKGMQDIPTADDLRLTTKLAYGLQLMTYAQLGG